jgi:hypothetical protein|tara:strand:+ start:652 stop:876 length:225 start_codon:yes stop_codon:yes gene_type:complete
MARNYIKEYANYHAKGKQVSRRSDRNKTRRLLSKTGKVSKGDGMDIHHIDGNPKNRSMGNLSVMSKSRNRSRKV